MTLVLVGKDLALGANKGQMGSRCILYLYIPYEISRVFFSDGTRQNAMYMCQCRSTPYIGDGRPATFNRESL